MHILLPFALSPFICFSNSYPYNICKSFWVMDGKVVQSYNSNRIAEPSKCNNPLIAISTSGLPSPSVYHRLLPLQMHETHNNKTGCYYQLLPHKFTKVTELDVLSVVGGAANRGMSLETWIVNMMFVVVVFRLLYIYSNIIQNFDT